jgi:hemoglobin
MPGTGEERGRWTQTAFLAEVVDRPTRYTDELGGFPALLKPHRDKRTRDTLRGYLERHPRRRPELPRHW